MNNFQNPPKIAVVSRMKNMRVGRKKIRAMVEFVLSAERARVSAITVVVVGSREIAAMNRKFLRHCGPTDVISFDLSDDCERVFEIVVCGEVARRQAKLIGHGLGKELLLYVVHGLLHQLGYDDTTAAKARLMRTRQGQLLKKFANSTWRAPD